MRTTEEAIRWYRTHETKAEIGFDPDGMCQKICRTARAIGPGAPSAFASMMMTPKEHQIRDISKLRPGHVIYFDDPRDDNPFGHIVTMMQRLQGYTLGDLNGIVVRTNSVKSDHIVPVRASYFLKHWGDPYVFGSDWLNGQVFTDMKIKKPKRLKLQRVQDIVQSLESNLKLLDKAIATQEKKDNARAVKALKRDRKKLVASIADLEQTLKTLGRR